MKLYKTFSAWGFGAIGARVVRVHYMYWFSKCFFVTLDALNGFVETCISIYVLYHPLKFIYRQVSNIRRTLVGNSIVDHSDVVGASPVGAAPTTSSFST